MPPIDDRTPKLDLPLPAQPNTLKNDVQRLRDTITKLDEKVVTIDPTTGKMDSSFLPDKVAVLIPPHATLDPNMLPAEVVTKDVNGKIDSSLLKDDVVTNIYDVASEVLMLDLTQATIGDIANFPQTGRTFQLMRMPPTERNNWKEQVSTAVTSVNGRKGDVVVAEPGINADITQLTKLSGPLTLGGDGQTDDDAVTVRQLKGAMGTSGGASMSGVMNNFIGAVEWFNGPLTAIPAGYIPANGQPVSQVDEKTRDLWTAVKNGMFTSVTEALWITDSLQGVSNRAAYSTGGAAGTCPDASIKDAWFRIPDLNGVQLNSTPNLFLMGWNGKKINNIYSVGAALTQGAPNITGSFKTRVPNGHGNEGTGAIRGGSGLPGLNGNVPVNYGNMVFSSPTTTLSDFPDAAGYGYNFNAQLGAEPYTSFSIPGYATYGAYSDGALRPNNAVGYWIIRANGSFVSANSNFQCINGHDTQQADQQVVLGGQFTSSYQVAGTETAAASFTVQKRIGTGISYARIGVFSKAEGARPDVLTNWSISSDYIISANQKVGGVGETYHINMGKAGTLLPDLHTSAGGGCGVKAWNPNTNNGIELNNTISDPAENAIVNQLTGWWYKSRWFIGGYRADDQNIRGTQIKMINQNNVENWWNFVFDASGNITTTAGTIAGNGSDRRLKQNITDAATGAPERIAAIQPRDFEWIAQGRADRGYIAQELRDIDPRYVYEGGGYDDAPILNVSHNAIIADLIGAVQALQAEVAELKAKS